MENICLDSDVLVDFLRNKKEAIDFINSNELKNSLATTTINIFELYYGAMLSARVENNMQAVKDLEKRLILLNLSPQSCERAAKILCELEKEGDNMEFRDLFIGAVALNDGFVLKTNNKKHFSKIKELKII